MPDSSAISNQTDIRSGAVVQRYLIVHTPSVMLQFNPSVAAPNPSNAQISFSATLDGAYTNVLSNMTVYITPTADYQSDIRNDRENCYIGFARKAPTSSLLYIKPTPFQWTTSHYVTVVDNFEVHDKPLRVVDNVVYRNYDVGFRKPLPRISGIYWDVIETSGSNADYSPTPTVTDMDGASGGSATHSWDVIENGVVSTAVSTSATPTINLPLGTHWVIDNATINSVTQSIAILVAVIPADFSSVVHNSIAGRITKSLDKGNSAVIEVRADAAGWLDGSAAMVYSKAFFVNGNTDAAVDMVGWLGAMSQSLQGDAEVGRQQEATVTLAGIGDKLAETKLDGWWYRRKSSPSSWNNEIQLKRVTPYDVIWNHLAEHTTIPNVCALDFPANYTNYSIGEISAPNGDLLSVVNSLAFRASGGMLNFWANGELAFRKSALYEVDSSTRDGLTTYATYTIASKDVLSSSPQRPPANSFAFQQVRGGFAVNNTTTNLPDGYYAESHAGVLVGSLTEDVDGILLEEDTSRANALVETGQFTANHFFAANETLNMSIALQGGYLRVQPSCYQWHKLVSASGDFLLGDVWDSGKRFLCLEVQLEYDAEAGASRTTIQLREESNGGDNYANLSEWIPEFVAQQAPVYPIGNPASSPYFDGGDANDDTFGDHFSQSQAGYSNPADAGNQGGNIYPPPGVGEIILVPFKGGQVGSSFLTSLGVDYLLRIRGVASIGHGAILDSFGLNSASSSPTSGSYSTDTEKQYLVRITGDMFNALPSTDRKRDAQNSTIDAWASVSSQDNWIRFALEGGGTEAPMADDSTYNALHRYEFTRDGTGDPFELLFLDSPYGDNSGTLTIDVFVGGDVMGDAFYWVDPDGGETVFASGYGLQLDGADFPSIPEYDGSHNYSYIHAGTGNQILLEWVDPDGDYTNNDNKFLIVEVVPQS